MPVAKRVVVLSCGNLVKKKSIFDWYCKSINKASWLFDATPDFLVGIEFLLKITILN